MRNAKGLVQVQMAHVSAQITRTAQTHHSVHIGPVDVDLTAMFMRDPRHFCDRFLENTVGRRICDHAACEALGILLGLGSKILQIDVPVLRGLDGHHLPADHLRRGRVRAMSAHRNETDIAMLLTPRRVIAGNRQQPRVFPLRAGVGLHGNRVVASDIAKLVAQVVNHLLVTQSLIRRGKGMQQRKLPPAHRHHLGCRVELHRTGSQGDHRPVERQIAIGQTPHVAHHLRLSPVHVENRVGEIVGCAQHGLREAILRRKVLVLSGNAKGPPDRLNRVRTTTLIQTDADTPLADAPQVEPFIYSRFQHGRLQRANIHRYGIETSLGIDLEAGLLQTFRQTHGLAVNPLPNSPEPVGPMKHRVH